MTVAARVKDASLVPFAGRTLMVGVFDGDQEVEAEGYERQAVQFSEPQGAGVGEGDNDVRFVENLDEPSFELGTADPHHLDRFAVFDDAGFLADYPLLKERDLPAGDRTFFRVGTLRIGTPG